MRKRPRAERFSSARSCTRSSSGLGLLSVMLEMKCRWYAPVHVDIAHVPLSRMGYGQCKVEFQHIDTRLAHEAEELPLCVRVDECLNLCNREASCIGDAGRLVVRGSDTDIGIQTTSRSGDEVDRDGLVVLRIGGFQRPDSAPPR